MPAEEPPTPPADNPPARRSLAGYIRDSFPAFFAQPGWWWRSALGALVIAVPFVGPIVVRAYSLIWMRRTAWDPSSPWPRLTQPKELLPVAGRFVAVGLGWGFLFAVFAVPVIAGYIGLGIWMEESGFTASVPAAVPIVVGAIATTLLVVAIVAAFLLVEIGTLRATIYERAGAGVSLDGPLQLLKRHPGGFVRALVTALLAGIPAAALGALQDLPGGYIDLDPALSTTWAAVTTALFLPTAYIEFCALMLSDRAWGLWISEIDPRTLGPLGKVPGTMPAPPSDPATPSPVGGKGGTDPAAVPLVSEPPYSPETTSRSAERPQ